MHTVLESEFQNKTCKSTCPFLNIQLNDSLNRKLKWSSSFTVPNSSCLKWGESMCAIKYPNFVYSTGKFVSFFTISKHCCEIMIYYCLTGMNIYCIQCQDTTSAWLWVQYTSQAYAWLQVTSFLVPTLALQQCLVAKMKFRHTVTLFSSRGMNF